MTQPNTMWTQWPSDRPRPSPAELEAARIQYKASLKSGDDSDFAGGLEFVMSTYARWTWWHFFFPSEHLDTPFVYNPCDWSARRDP